MKITIILRTRGMPKDAPNRTPNRTPDRTPNRTLNRMWEKVARLCSTCAPARHWALVKHRVPLLDQHWVHLEVCVHAVMPPVVRWSE